MLKRNQILSWRYYSESFRYQKATSTHHQFLLDPSRPLCKGNNRLLLSYTPEPKIADNILTFSGPLNHRNARRIEQSSRRVLGQGLITFCDKLVNVRKAPGGFLYCDMSAQWVAERAKYGPQQVFPNQTASQDRLQCHPAFRLPACDQPSPVPSPSSLPRAARAKIRDRWAIGPGRGYPHAARESSTLSAR